MTVITVYGRLNANFLTRLQIRDVFTYFLNNAAEFVTQCQWRGFTCEAMWTAGSWDEVVSSQVFMEISPAYTDVSGSDLCEDHKYVPMKMRGVPSRKERKGL